MDYIRREDLREEMVAVPSNTYEQIWIPVSDINTYHPKDAEITEDRRKGN